MSHTRIQGLQLARGELLGWLNNMLNIEPPLSKVEQCGTGAVYCQVSDLQVYVG